MSIASKNRIIAYVLLIYFLTACGTVLYLSHSDFRTFLNMYLWQHNSSRIKKSRFSSINHERWLRLQKKFSIDNLHLLWKDEYLRSNNTKTLIYRCESFCGGLGDRLRGIVSSYFLALLMHRKFMIDMHYPCEITHLLKPHMYNWIYQKLKNDSIRSTKVIQAIDTDDILRELHDSPFVDRWAKYDDIDIYTNLDLITAVFDNSEVRKNTIINLFLQQMLPEEANFQTLFPLLFEVLFKPAEKVVDLIDPILERVISSDSSLLCLHIRIGQNPTNPKDQLLKDRTSITDDMIAFVKAHILPNEQKLLILAASDSNDVVSKVQHHFSNQFITVQGPIIHMDRPSSMENVDNGCLTVLATFYMLGECHINVLTNSGFSALANRRRIDPYANLYKYNFKKKRIERCENVVSTSQWEPKQSAKFVLYCPVVIKFSVREV